MESFFDMEHCDGYVTHRVAPNGSSGTEATFFLRVDYAEREGQLAFCREGGLCV